MSARILVAVAAFVLMSPASPAAAQATGPWTAPMVEQAIPSSTPPVLSSDLRTLAPGIESPPRLTEAERRFQEEDVSPGGAFLRSLVLPGWGHVATGAPGRGAFYVAAQSGSLWMLWKSRARRSVARSGAALEREILRERLLRQGVTDPQTLFTLVDGDPAVVEWETLLDTRDQQVEDWAAMSIFLVLLGAADAYVTAHLRDFPEPLSIQAVPNPGSGGVDFGLSVRFPGRSSPGR